MTVRGRGVGMDGKAQLWIFLISSRWDRRQRDRSRNEKETESRDQQNAVFGRKHRFRQGVDLKRRKNGVRWSMGSTVWRSEMKKLVDHLWKRVLDPKMPQDQIEARRRQIHNGKTNIKLLGLFEENKEATFGSCSEDTWRSDSQRCRHFVPYRGPATVRRDQETRSKDFLSIRYPASLSM